MRRGPLGTLAVQWKRWRKYPLQHLAAGVVHRCYRKISRRTRRPPLDSRAPDVSIEDPQRFCREAGRRLGLPVLEPGRGLPHVPPFRIESDDAATLSTAQAVAEGTVYALGRALPLPAGPEWGRDPTSGYLWPTDPTRSLSITPGRGVDVKVPWELGRLHHVAAPLEVYLKTGEPRWARLAVEHSLEFLEANPYGMGVHWLGSMEVAIRAANLAYVLVITGSTGAASRSEVETLVRALYLHAWHVRRELSWNPHSRGNHYLCELVGLSVAGQCLGDLGEAVSITDFALSEIIRESETQIRTDGTNWESSTNYHRFVAELFAVGAHVAEQFAVPRESLDRLRARVRAMTTVVAAYTRPDGSAPLLGDVDDGRLFAFGMAGLPGNQHRARLAAVAPPEPVSPRSEAFAESGWYVQRGADALVMIRCGPPGLNGRAAHDHADQLSVDVTLGGVALFVDPGTAVYTGHPEARQRARGTAAHNTVCVDGFDQIEYSPASTFEVETEAPASTLQWEVDSDRVLFEGQHEGYSRLASPVTHRRSVELASDGQHLLIRDTLDGAPTEHSVEWTLQCSDGCSVSIDEEARLFSVRNGGQLFEVVVDAPPDLRLGISDGLVSAGYGVESTAPALKLKGRARVPLVVTLSVRPIGDSPSTR